MDTGPRFGDILLENSYKVGSRLWYEVEFNNAEYHRRNSKQKEPTTLTTLIGELVETQEGTTLSEFLSSFNDKKL